MITNQVIRKTLSAPCAPGNTPANISWMLQVCKRAAFRNMRLGADLRQLPLAGIAPKRAHGPDGLRGVDPGGLWGFVSLRLDVWVDLRGRRRQFCACHVAPLPPRLPPAEQRPICSSRCQSWLRDRRRLKTASSSHFSSKKTEEEFLPPCRITGFGDKLRGTSALLLLAGRSFIPGRWCELPLRLSFRRRHSVTSSTQPTPDCTGSPTGYITANMVKGSVMIRDSFGSDTLNQPANHSHGILSIRGQWAGASRGPCYPQ